MINLINLLKKIKLKCKYKYGKIKIKSLNSITKNPY